MSASPFLAQLVKPPQQNQQAPPLDFSNKVVKSLMTKVDKPPPEPSVADIAGIVTATEAPLAPSPVVGAGS